MTKFKKIKVAVSPDIGSVSALLCLPEEAEVLLVLAHGAGAGMEHPFMEMLAEGLAVHKIGTLRFNFAYMEKGGGAPDRPKKAHQVIASVIKKAGKYADGRIILAGGKSFGGRMMSQMAAQGELSEVKGIVYFGFPLHAPGKPGIARAAHLTDITIPQLFLQGTRDSLASIDLMEEVVKPLSKAKLVRVEGGDHSFKMLKRSGRTNDDAIEELASSTAVFVHTL